MLPSQTEAASTPQIHKGEKWKSSRNWNSMKTPCRWCQTVGTWDSEQHTTKQIAKQCWKQPHNQHVQCIHRGPSCLFNCQTWCCLFEKNKNKKSTTTCQDSQSIQPDSEFSHTHLPTIYESEITLKVDTSMAENNLALDLRA